MRIARILTLCLCVAAVSSIGGCATSGTYTSPTQSAPIRLSEPTHHQLEMLDVAEAAREIGDYDEALAIFQEILAENPTITTAYLGIGDIYIIKKDYAKAEPAYGRAARLEPNNFDAQYGHGLALQMLRRFFEAVDAYRRALAVDPESIKANLNLATTYLQLNDPQVALRFAEAAVELDPANGPARANLGAIYEKLGQYDEAVTAYDEALELMGNRPHLMMNQISVLARQKRYREAANTAGALIRIEPSAAAYERLGWCCFKLGDYDKSLDAYRTAVEYDPDYWPAHNGVGVNALNRWLLSDKTDLEARNEARDALRKSLRVNPHQQKVIKLMLNYNL